MPIIENKNITSLRKFGYFFVFSIVLACFFSYYLFVFVAKKEQEIVNRNYRILEKMGVNLEARLIDNYRLFTRISNDSSLVTSESGFSFSRKTLPGTHLNDTFPARVIFSEANKKFALEKPFKQIFSDLRRKDIFNFHLVANLKNRKILYCDSVLLNPLSRYDTALFTGNGQFNTRKRITIAGEDYFIFTHPFALNSESLIAIGLVSEASYAGEKFSVPETFLLILIVTICLILVFFPFLKSLLISPQETLNSTDIFATVLSLFMIFALHSFIQVRLGRDKFRNEDNLKNLAVKIDTTFQSELHSLYQQAVRYDTGFIKDIDLEISKLNKNELKPGNRNIKGEQVLNTMKSNYYNLIDTPTSLNDEIKDLNLKPKYPNFKYIFWLESDGREAFRWSTGKVKIPKTTASLRDREYFKAIMQEKYWYLKSDQTKKFYFETVSSWVDGSYRTVVSLPGLHPNYPVVAITTELSSVQNIILPDALKYCIIDDKGKVLFHSDSKKNSTENILDDIRNPKLAAAMLSHSEKSFNNYYMGSSNAFYIKPIGNLPLFVVTFTDRQYAGNIDLLIFILTFTHVLMILLIIVLTIFIYMFLLRKVTRLTKKRILSFEILYPLKKNRQKDIYLLLFNLFLIAFSFIISQNIYGYPILIYCLFITTAICSTSLSLYLRDNQLESRKLILGGYFTFFTIADILLKIMVVPQDKTAFLIFFSIIVIQVFYLFVIYLHFYYPKLISESSQSKFNKSSRWVLRNAKNINQKVDAYLSKSKRPDSTINAGKDKFYNTYILLLMSFFMLLGTIPTFRLYQYFYNEEYTHLLKNMQLQLARNIFENSNNLLLKNASRDYDYLDAYFNTKVKYSKLKNGSRDNEEQDLVKEYLSLLPLPANAISRKMPRLYSEDTSRSFIEFKKNGKDNLLLNYTSSINHKTLNTNELSMESKVPILILPITGTRAMFFFYVGFVCFMIFMYFFIQFFIKRYFHFNLFPADKILNKENELLELFKISYNGANANTIRHIVVGVPKSGKNTMLKTIINELETDNKALYSDEKLVKIYDLSSLKPEKEVPVPDFTDFKGKIIILKHFDYDLMDEQVQRKKLDLIESLIQNINYHIIITASIHPSIFLKSLKKESSMFSTEDYFQNNEHYNWSAVLSGFEVYVHPMIWPLKDPIHEANIEEVIYKTHHAHYPYFHALWGSLSKNEKFVLFDIAEDNMANYKNREAILSLYKKGIIVYEDEPRLIHESLRDFVLSEINDDDISKERKEVEQSSAWSKFRIPFLVITVVLLFFVFQTQKETFNQVMAVIAGFAATIPSLLKLLNSSSGK